MGRERASMARLAPGSSRAATGRGLAAPMMVTPATATPVRTSRHRPLEEVKCAYFGPGADQIVTQESGRLQLLRMRENGHDAACGLLGRDAAGGLGKALDPLLDLPQRFQAGFNGAGRDVPQHI
jgi:hypothetical protein